MWLPSVRICGEAIHGNQYVDSSESIHDVRGAAAQVCQGVVDGDESHNDPINLRWARSYAETEQQILETQIVIRWVFDDVLLEGRPIGMDTGAQCGRRPL
jgi:hypothetical protein